MLTCQRPELVINASLVGVGTRTVNHWLENDIGEQRTYAESQQHNRAHTAGAGKKHKREAQGNKDRTALAHKIHKVGKGGEKASCDVVKLRNRTGDSGIKSRAACVQPGGYSCKFHKNNL